jgi:hypothetical protein
VQLHLGSHRTGAGQEAILAASGVGDGQEAPANRLPGGGFARPEMLDRQAARLIAVGTPDAPSAASRLRWMIAYREEAIMRRNAA